MNATTYYGEFKFRHADETSDLAKAINRLLCQLRHPSMSGRDIDVSAYFRELMGPDALPDPS